ncbi:MAG: YaiI/YqxD family protein [Hyphomicrobiaceae bacterium]
MPIYVDADACPVKDEVLRVAERHGWQVFMVSNSFMRLPAHPLINRVVVEDGPDVADNWIAERAVKGDVVVTSDIPLAHRCVKAGAIIIRSDGKVLDQGSIGMALAMRNLMQDLREAGNMQTYNASFTKGDRSKFLQALETAIQAIKRGI